MFKKLNSNCTDQLCGWMRLVKLTWLFFHLSIWSFFVFFGITECVCVCVFRSDGWILARLLVHSDHDVTDFSQHQQQLLSGV